MNRISQKIKHTLRYKLILGATLLMLHTLVLLVQTHALELTVFTFHTAVYLVELYHARKFNL